MNLRLDERDPESSVVRGGTVGAGPILSLAKYAIDKGMRRSRVENLIGFSLNRVHKEKWVPALSGPLLFAQMLDSGIGDAPAIEVAQNVPYSFFGGVERAIMLAPNGREALRAFSDNFAIFHNKLIPEIDESRTYFRFSFRFRGQEFDNGCCNEVVLSVLVRLMRSVFGPFGQPHEAQLRFGRNGLASAYRDFFRSSTRFCSEDQSYGLVWKKTDLTQCQPGHDPWLFDAAKHRLAAATTKRQRNTSTDNFLELISASNLCVTNQIFSVSGVAAQAGLGERTAQRIAQRHGSSVRKLIDEARLRLLREKVSRSPSVGAEDLSALVGFSDSRALRRALKMWTGLPLAQFRETPLASNSQGSLAAAAPGSVFP